MSSSSDASRHGQIDERGTPTLELRVVSPPRVLLRAVVDTGFEGGVGLPTGSFARWGLTDLVEGNVRLANGKEHPCTFALLEVDWFDEAKEIWAYELEGSDVLIGMELLDGTRLELQSPNLVIAPLSL